MKRILLGLVAVVAIGIGVLAFAMSRNAACPSGPPSTLAAGATPMLALVHRCYGPPDVATIESVAKPTPAADEILVKVATAGINPLDWHYVRGEPYLMRLDAGLGQPKNPRLGVDFAGTVEAVGTAVTRFKPGDLVWGTKNGALAEFVVVKADGNVMPKPARLSLEQAGAIGVAGVTALQAVRDEGLVKPGQKVLVNGASGGVGTYAVQIAKALGAEVTGVCSTRNVELVRSLGADHVIDYTKDDFTEGTERYDVVIDNVANHSFLEVRRAMTPQGRYVIVGANTDGRWLGPLAAPLKAMLVKPFVSQTPVFFLAGINVERLQALQAMVEAGKLTPVIDRQYPLAQGAEALAYLEKGRARGKVVVQVGAAR